MNKYIPKVFRINAAIRNLAQRCVSRLNMHIFTRDILHLAYLEPKKKRRTNLKLVESLTTENDSGAHSLGPAESEYVLEVECAATTNISVLTLIVCL